MTCHVTCRTHHEQTDATDDDRSHLERVYAVQIAAENRPSECPAVKTNSSNNSTVMKLGLSVFWLPYSDPESKPITSLLTNVLIFSVKYTILPSVRRNVNVLIEAVP